jgi:hypothetical protein
VCGGIYAARVSGGEDCGEDKKIFGKIKVQFGRKTMKNIRKQTPYITTVIIVITVLCLIYRDADLSYPLVYSGGDEMGIFYWIKTIKHFGIRLVNPMVGGTTGGDMYDYIFSDKLSFFIVKVISIFVENTYLIANIFYFLSHILVSLSSVYVCRKLHYSAGISIMVSVLYAFSVFMQTRYAHLWLTPYFMLPFSCLLSLKIVRGEIVCGKVSIWKDQNFYKALLISFCCAFTGFYYAFFTCILVAVAIVIRMINAEKGAMKKEGYHLCFILSVIIGCIMNVIPNMLYWIKNGFNPESEIATRGIGDAEIYGLKFIQLILPRQEHRISVFRELSNKYCEKYPLVNENATSAIGIIATVGFVASLIWLYSNRKENKDLSYLNISVFLIATIGGIGSIFSLFFPTPMRAYNRMSLIIMFYSLLCVAELLKRFRMKCTKKVYGIVISVVLCIGIFDQTQVYAKYDYTVIDQNRKFIDKIEKQLPQESMVYELPFARWPSGGNYRLFIPYLESAGLHWSYGAMQGRPEAKWQQMVSRCDIETMLALLAKKGYAGIYLDKIAYLQTSDEANFQQVFGSLNKALGLNPMISDDGNLFFWDIREYARNFESGFTVQDKKKMNVLANMAMYFETGFNREETGEGNVWNWCNGKEGSLAIYNYTKDTAEIQLNACVITQNTDIEYLLVETGGEKKRFEVDSSGKMIELRMELSPGCNMVNFKFEGDIVNANGLSFQIRNLKIVDIFE